MFTNWVWSQKWLSLMRWTTQIFDPQQYQQHLIYVQWVYKVLLRNYPFSSPEKSCRVGQRYFLKRKLRTNEGLWLLWYKDVNWTEQAYLWVFWFQTQSFTISGEGLESYWLGHHWRVLGLERGSNWSEWVQIWWDFKGPLRTAFFPVTYWGLKNPVEDFPY